MSDLAEIGYTSREIRSYLPGGWSLAERGNSGAWNDQRKVWAVQVLDTAEVEWTLEVATVDARADRRLDALEKATQRLYRNGLG